MKDLLLFAGLTTVGVVAEVFIFYCLIKLLAYFNNGKIPLLIQEILHLDFLAELADEFLKK